LASNQSTAVVVPSLASRDAAFVSLAQEPLQRTGELLSGQAITPLLDNLAPFADLAWTPGGVLVGSNPLESLNIITPSSSQAVHSDGSAMGLHSTTLAGDGSGTPLAAMDVFSVGLTIGAGAADE
jgi:hypothetical protein